MVKEYSDSLRWTSDVKYVPNSFYPLAPNVGTIVRDSDNLL